MIFTLTKVANSAVFHKIDYWLISQNQTLISISFDQCICFSVQVGTQNGELVQDAFPKLNLAELEKM